MPEQTPLEAVPWPAATALLASLEGHADYCCRSYHPPEVPLLTCCTCGAQPDASDEGHAHG